MILLHLSKNPLTAAVFLTGEPYVVSIPYLVVLQNCDASLLKKEENALIKDSEMNELIALSLVEIAKNAGKAILAVYNSSDFDLEMKADNSPLTKADKASHEILSLALKEMSEVEYPILSEEGEDIHYNERKDWDYYWLIDPLDGTKEFIKKNGEFTVNIALMKQNKPVFGVVYAPVLELCYYGGEEFGAWKLLGENKEQIQGHILNSDVLTVVASRSHLTKETSKYIDSLKDTFPRIETVSSGSSLKLCMVADGQADVYPRLAPTMEWDTAAADAICRAAGCTVIQYETGEVLEYNKENLLNPWFIVKGQRV